MTALIKAPIDKIVADYAALRAYTGPASQLYVVGTMGTAKPSGIAGVFQHDPADTTSTDNGGTIIVGSDGRRWKRDYRGAENAAWWGLSAMPDADNAPALTAALAGAGGALDVPGGEWRIASGVTVTKPGQVLRLAPDCVLNLDTTTASVRAVTLAGAGSMLVGGSVTTTLRTLAFLVNCQGANTKARDVSVYFGTKSTLGPINGNNIPYNRGGIEVNGSGAGVELCDIYNQEGAGIVSYGTRVVLRENKIHDNILGVHVTVPANSTNPVTVSLLDNEIYDNNVNGASGADGVLTSVYSRVIMRGNRITGSGEHGAYVYSNRATIVGNTFTGNHANGLKVRASQRITVTGNIVVDNNTGGNAGVGELVIQASEKTGEPINLDKIVVSNNVCDGANSIGIITNWTETTPTLSNLVVTGNTCNSIYLAFTENLVVTNNECTTALVVGAAFPNAPLEQNRAVVKGNEAPLLDAGRVINSTFEGNECETFGPGSVGTLRRNRIINNKMTAQSFQIQRDVFDVFTGNDVNCSALGNVPLLPQASARSNNDNKVISNNVFRAHQARVIDDSSSVISGNKNIICNNQFDRTSDALSFWGAGHVVMGNVNINNGGVGFLGCNDSRLIGNVPNVSLRAGTTGNTTL